MVKVLLLPFIVLASAAATLVGLQRVDAAPTGSQAFSYSGSAQSFVVPTGVTEIFVDLTGAQGGNAFGTSQRGGLGAEVVARVPVTPGETLKVYVGSQPTTRPSGGYNGGGLGGNWTAKGAGGGGGTDVRRGPSYGLFDRLVVAGAGGGAGTYTPGGAGGTGSGGAGGAPNGQNGFPGAGIGSPTPGYGATQIAGGAPGGTLPPPCSTGSAAQPGTFGTGGAAQTGSYICNGGGAGGGGGGWYGGGGAQGTGPNSPGGGGGSSYVDPASELLGAYPGVRQGNGAAIISWGQALPVGGGYTTAETLGGGACGGSDVQADVGKPVNTANGNFWHTYADLTIPGRGPSIDLVRTYNTANAATMGLFGYGWTSPFDSSITVSSSTATVRRGNGSRITFTKDALGAWFAPPRADSTMTAGPSGTWVVTCNARTVLTFDSSGRLIRHADPNGDGLTVTYPSSTQTVVTDDAGRTLTMTLSSSRVVQAIDSASRTVQYTYNIAGELTDVVDTEGGRAQFTYDASHRMITMRSPRFYGDTSTTPSPVVTTHYDASGRVDWQTDELGHQTTFNYTTAPGSTIVTDPEGHAIKYKYLYGMLVERIDGYGTAGAATWSFTYDPVSTVAVATTDPNGSSWTQTADANGNITATEDPLGRSRTAAYNAFGAATTITDATGVTTTLSYDARGNLTGRSTPWLEGSPNSSQDTTFTYGDASNPGDVTEVVNPLGEMWLYSYDTYGNLVTSEDPLGNVTQICFDSIGLASAVVSPRGTAAGITCSTPAPAAFTSYYTYNTFGQSLTATDPEGGVTTNTYDANRNLITTQNPNGHTTVYTYDAADRRVAEQRPDSSIVATSYWHNGALKAQSDGASASTTYGYDPLGRVMTVTDPLGRTTSYNYDAAGNLTTEQQPGGDCTAVPRIGCITYGYDPANQAETVDYSDPSTPDITDATYDLEGRRTAIDYATSGTSTWAYDSLGRLTASSDGTTLGYGYDLANRRTALTYPGGLVVDQVFDDAGRLTDITDWNNATTQFVYNADSDITNIVYSTGSQSDEIIYDDAGRPVTISFIAGGSPLASLDNTRDAAGQITAED